jgi:hypothetical protein
VEVTACDEHVWLATYIHTYMHAYIHTCIHTYIHTYMHTYIHTYIHAYIHTYIHTYIHSGCVLGQTPNSRSFILPPPGSDNLLHLLLLVLIILHFLICFPFVIQYTQQVQLSDADLSASISQVLGRPVTVRRTPIAGSSSSSAPASEPVAEVMMRKLIYQL